MLYLNKFCKFRDLIKNIEDEDAEGLPTIPSIYLPTYLPTDRPTDLPTYHNHYY